MEKVWGSQAEFMKHANLSSPIESDGLWKLLYGGEAASEQQMTAAMWLRCMRAAWIATRADLATARAELDAARRQIEGIWEACAKVADDEWCASRGRMRERESYEDACERIAAGIRQRRGDATPPSTGETNAES